MPTHLLRASEGFVQLARVCDGAFSGWSCDSLGGQERHSWLLLLCLPVRNRLRTLLLYSEWFVEHTRWSDPGVARRKSCEHTPHVHKRSDVLARADEGLS